MRRWIRLAATLYPRGWRARYGDEFQALLEDVRPGWREFADVTLGALKMQMSTANTYLKIGGAAAVAGVVLSMAASFAVPRQYVSEAVVRMTPKPAAQEDPSAAPREALDYAAAQFQQLAIEFLSRNSLVEIVQDPSLDLYKQERQRMPMEDVIQGMKQEIQIRPVQTLPSASGPPLTARISFAYPDKEKAQEVVRLLVTRFVTLNTMLEKSRAAQWHIAWPPSDPLPPGEEVVVLDPPSTPKPVSPNRLEFMGWGLGGGLILGLLATTGIRRPKWTLQMAGFAVAGCALAVAGSLLVPDQYTSTAVLRFFPPIAPQRVSGLLAGRPAAEKFLQLEQPVADYSKACARSLSPGACPDADGGCRRENAQEGRQHSRGGPSTGHEAGLHHLFLLSRSIQGVGGRPRTGRPV